ncbi:MAG: putative dehydrogenase [Verrucomicrobiales bacterium]
MPGGFNFDLWEGPAPHRDYRPALLPRQWRHNYDYSGGMVTDFGAHHIDIVQWALDMDTSGPVKFENFSATLPDKSELYNTATSFHFEAIYKDGTRMIVADDRSSTGEILFEGEDGKSILATRDALTMTPTELRREKIQDNEIKLQTS